MNSRGKEDHKYLRIGTCDIEIPVSCCLVIFGASGELTRKKLIPSLYRLYKNRLLPEGFFLLGVSRTKWTTSMFRESTETVIRDEYPSKFNPSEWNEFASKLHYIPVDYFQQESYKLIKEKLSSLEGKYGAGKNRILYLAVPPSAFEGIIINLGVAGFVYEEGIDTHIVIEKPFGRDIDSAKRLNRIVRQFFEEKHIFRIDHFIAKETVQNIIMFRFANSIFEPLWNNKYIDHVQITVAENIGIGKRAGYYEDSGVIRDMFPNHIFQLLAITAMDPPPIFETEAVRDEKTRVFKSLRPIPLNRIDEFVVVGQYGRGIVDGMPVAAYREEEGVSEDSITPTFAAMRIFIDNWRWRGVPFYLRSGKRLKSRKTEIAVQFKPVPHLMFENHIGEPITPNTLVLRIQPDEGISLTLQTKRPGSTVCLSTMKMDFVYPKDIQLDAYEWVLLECMRGDQMLFIREDGVELTWSFLTPVIERLESTIKKENFPNYEAGSPGPEEASSLIEKDGHEWRSL